MILGEATRRHSPITSAAVTPRRFPPPWFVEDIGAALVVQDSAGQQLALHLFRG
jgi:hypothetical protein